MLLPGPEAQQLAIYTGWLLNGVRGGLIAGTLFVLPGMLALLALSAVYVGFGDTAVVAAVFAGLAPAVIAIVVQAVFRVAQRSLTHPALVALAAAAFVALTFFAVPFPVVVLGAGLLGWLVSRRLPALHGGGGPEAGRRTGAPGQRRRAAPRPAVGPPFPSGARCSAWCCGPRRSSRWRCWSTRRRCSSTKGCSSPALPWSRSVARTRCWPTWPSRPSRSTAGWHRGRWSAVWRWRRSTPGPLIMVVQFVAFLGAYRDPGTLNPWVAGVLASLLTVWVTFVPCFLFIFLGAPYVERLRGNRHLTAALNGITAAVVGVIASLAIVLRGPHAVLGHPPGRARTGPGRPACVVSVNPVAVGITVLALVLMFGRSWSPLRTLGVCAAVGLVVGIIGLLT